MNFNSIFQFLKSLSKNNNRDWFEQNKGRYLEEKELFENFVGSLLRDLTQFDTRLMGLDPKKLVFRIYESQPPNPLPRLLTRIGQLIFHKQ